MGKKQIYGNTEGYKKYILVDSLVDSCSKTRRPGYNIFR